MKLTTMSFQCCFGHKNVIVSSIITKDYCTSINERHFCIPIMASKHNCPRNNR